MDEFRPWWSVTITSQRIDFLYNITVVNCAFLGANYNIRIDFGRPQACASKMGGDMSILRYKDSVSVCHFICLLIISALFNSDAHAAPIKEPADKMAEQIAEREKDAAALTAAERGALKILLNSTERLLQRDRAFPTERLTDLTRIMHAILSLCGRTNFVFAFPRRKACASGARSKR